VHNYVDDIVVRMGLLIVVGRLCTGIFGVPLDVCAQSMYRAISEVANKVSNLSLREVHLVNVDAEMTQLIQSIFLQLNSSDGAGPPESEKPPPEALSEPPEGPRSDNGEPASSVGTKDDVHYEILDRHEEQNVHSSAVETAPDGQKTPEEDVDIDSGHLRPAAAEQPGTCVPRDEDISDKEPSEEQKMPCQHPVSSVPDRVDDPDDGSSREQKSHAGVQLLPFTDQIID